jgi:hypothetical protein
LPGWTPNGPASFITPERIDAPEFSQSKFSDANLIEFEMTTPSYEGGALMLRQAQYEDREYA